MPNTEWTPNYLFMYYNDWTTVESFTNYPQRCITMTRTQKLQTMRPLKCLSYKSVHSSCKIPNAKTEQKRIFSFSINIIGIVLEKLQYLNKTSQYNNNTIITNSKTSNRRVFGLKSTLFFFGHSLQSYWKVKKSYVAYDYTCSISERAVRCL